MLGVFVEEGADAIGLNCNLVPADMLDLVRLLTSRTERPLFVRPTAAPDCRVHVHPADFATGVEALFALGAHAVGGCCGTGPDHIAAARSALDGAPAAFIR
jgi:methionine synthase I (cobalamin-dependent)